MEKTGNNDKNILNYWYLWLLIIVLTIIILLLLLRGCKNDYKEPTGNIDIFDIKCDCIECKDSAEPTSPVINDSLINENPSEGTSNAPPTEQDLNEEEENTPGFNVFDNEITWEIESELRIFTHSAYVISDKLAPGISNSYIYRVRNNNDFKVKYSMLFSEENNKNINMKYRLKKGDSYLVGGENEWVSYNILTKSDIILNSYSYDEYTLDWKWMESANDTEIGKNASEVDYRLGIEIVGIEI